MGDATNMVLIFGGELLKKAENLLVIGLHPSEIIKGYELACAKAVSELESAHVDSRSYSSVISRSTQIYPHSVSPPLLPNRRYPRLSSLQ